MRFVKPDYELLKLPNATNKMDVLKHLEKIGRVCYKSEDKITDDSCIKYLNMIRDRKHWAMLEHYIFVLSVPKYIYDDFYNCLELYNKKNIDPNLAHRLSFISMTHSSVKDVDSRFEYLISGSATAFNYLWECEMFQDYSNNHGMFELLMFMYNEYPEIMKHPYENNEGGFEHVKMSYDLREAFNSIHFLSRYQIESLPINLRLVHDSMTVKFVVDRGVSHELVRHRPASWAQESTRYVNYSKKGCTYVVPCWLSQSDKRVLLDEEKVDHIIEQIHAPHPFDCLPPMEVYGLSPAAIDFIYSLDIASIQYDRFLNNYQWTPQWARGILPHFTKTEVIMTARLNEWRHFFDMRADTPAHPQMREVVVPLLSTVGSDYGRINNPFYNIFKDQKKKYVKVCQVAPAGGDK